MKILCIGNATYDITLPVEGYPKENYKYRINTKIECGGGPAATAAYLLGKWHEDVAFCGSIGKDHYGETVKKELESANVNIKYLYKLEHNKTTLSYIIANKKNGSRTIITTKDKNLDIIKRDIIDKPKFILLDGEEFETAMSVLKNNPDCISIIDAGSARENVVNLCFHVNYIACSKKFAEEFTECSIENNMTSLIKIHQKIENHFKTNVIITLESRGAFTKINDEYKLIPSIEVESVDSTGAGDIFHGALVYFLSNDYPLEKAIYYANIAGALSVTKLGGRNSIFSLEEVLKKGCSNDFL